jgi:hypothetical protein
MAVIIGKEAPWRFSLAIPRSPLIKGTWYLCSEVSSLAAAVAVERSRGRHYNQTGFRNPAYCT